MNNIALYDWRSGKIVVHGENLEPLLSTVDGARRYRGEWRVPVESADALAASGIVDTSEISHLLGIKTTPVLSRHGAVLPVSMERVARKIGGEKINDRWYFNDASDVEVLKGGSTNGRRAKVNGKAALVSLGDLSKRFPNGFILYQHQRDTVESALSTDIAGKVLALDFGTGKTACAATIAHGLEKAYGLRTLVLGPASLKENWKRELSGMVSDPIILSDHHSQIPANFEQPFVLIADEAHRLAGESQRGESFVHLAGQASFVLPLTGVPVRHGNPETAYNMLRAIGHPSAMMDRKVFASRYSGSTSLVEQFYRHTKDYIIRVQKRDVLDLPPKTRIMRPVEIEPHDLEQYDRVYEAKKLEYQEGLRQGEKRAKYFNAALVHFIRQAASIAKVRTAIDIVEELLEQDRQVVLFVAYRETGRRLWRELHKYGMAVITGDTPVRDRQTQVDDFQKGKLKIALCTFGAAGFGLTLTKADTNILVDRPFSVESGDTDNAESRCIMEGQLVQTASGLVPIENIRKGDLVLTHKGNWKRVTAIKSKQNRDPVTEIEYYRYGKSLVTTYDHEILVSRDGNLSWMQAHEILPRDFLLMPRLKTHDDISAIEFPDELRYENSYMNNYGGLQTSGRYMPAPGVFDVTPDLLYALGYYLADGWISGNQLCFAGNKTTKKQVLERLLSMFHDMGISAGIYSHKSKNNAALQVYSKDMASLFLNWFNTGSEEKAIPMWIMNLPVEKLRCFLDGYIDGDGYKRNNQIEWGSVSIGLASQIDIIVSKIGHPTSFRFVTADHYKNQDYYVGSFTSTIANQVNTKPHLSQMDKDYIYHPVMSVLTHNADRESGDYKRVYDLTVEDDRSFVVGHAAVHNCDRIGQLNPVTMVWLQFFHPAQKSPDERLDQLIIDKHSLNELALSGKVGRLEFADGLGDYMANYLFED